MRDLTEKSRVLGQEENDSARTEQPSSQELRISPHSQEVTDKPSAKAKLKPTSSSLQPSSSEQITTHERKWLDIEPTPERYGILSHDISQRMITLLRHEQNILREEDGAIEFCRLKRDLNANFPYSVRWSDNTWVDHPKKRRRTKEEIPVMLQLQ